MLRRRAADEKVNVRKVALQALENIIRLDGDNFNKEVGDISFLILVPFILYCLIPIQHLRYWTVGTQAF